MRLRIAKKIVRNLVSGIGKTKSVGLRGAVVMYRECQVDRALDRVCRCMFCVPEPEFPVSRGDCYKPTHD